MSRSRPASGVGDLAARRPRPPLLPHRGHRGPARAPRRRGDRPGRGRAAPRPDRRRRADRRASTCSTCSGGSPRPGRRPTEFVAALAELKPRLYSISSSPKRHAGQVHLTVRRVAYEFNGRVRKGVASTMLADRVEPGSPVRVFVQKSHGFTHPGRPGRPDDHDRPGDRHRPVPRLPPRARRDRRHGEELALLRRPAERLRLPLRGRADRASSAAAS